MRFRNLPHRLKVATCIAAGTAMLSGSLLLSGCSTPKNAVVFNDGTAYSTADYLAYLYNEYQAAFYYNNLSQYAQSGMDPWGQKLSYGEGKDAKELLVEDYIIQMTQDIIIRQKAIADKLKEFNLQISAKDNEAFKKNMEQITNASLIPMGFNKATYENMYKATNYNEPTLFYGLYDKGGKRAMSDADIKTYYDTNIMTYKIVELALTDDQGKDLDAAGADKIKAKLQGYLDLYKANKDFDKVIEQFNADQQAASATTTSNPSETTAAGETTDTTAAATTTTTSTTTTTTSTAATTSAGSDGSGSDSDEQKDSNLKMLDANTDQADLVKAVQSVGVDEAKVVEYKKDGSTKTAALILRINPQSTEYKFEDSRQRVIYGAKYKEFNDEIKAYIKTITQKTKFNKTVLKKCTPKKLLQDQAEAQPA